MLVKYATFVAIETRTSMFAAPFIKLLYAPTWNRLPTWNCTGVASAHFMKLARDTWFTASRYSHSNPGIPGKIMFMANTGAVYARLVQNSERNRLASASVAFGMAPAPTRSDEDTSASNPASSIASINSRGPVTSGSNATSAEPSGRSTTETSSTPDTSRSTFSTAPVHAEHVIPSTYSFTTERDSSASRTCDASNPASSTACSNVSMRTTAPGRSSTAPSPVAADTAARVTPGTPSNAASTAPEQAEHVMPSTFSRTRVPTAGSSRTPSFAEVKRTRSGDEERASCDARERDRIAMSRRYSWEDREVTEDRTL
mmetsp:Transcript_357/g.1465  ORF Transcript_357/g.1465 Transcript_357/m.1465 type:complete len:314 (+) Transcript_357:2002-2943(+)